MKKRTGFQTRNLCTSALLIAASLLLPELFHMVGGQAAGGIFLPMHIPVLLAGLLMGPCYAAAVGVLAPILSFFVTGMPPAALLPFMVVELVSYGVISGWLSSRSVNIYVSLVSAMVGGRLINAAVLAAAFYLLHWNVSPAVSVLTAAVTGIPGIAIQLLLLPPLVVLLRKVVHFDGTNQAG